MDFRLSDDQVAIQQSVRRFAEERLAPMYAARDELAQIEPGLIQAQLHAESIGEL